MYDHDFEIMASLSMSDEEERAFLIYEAVQKLDSCSQISRKQALAAGKLDEVCPLCLRVFLAHITDSIVRECKRSPCHYDPPKRV